MKKINLLLTRHGETYENQLHLLQGQLPGRLSPLGIQQAEQLAVKLSDEPLDVIVCSDLARSFDTAMAVARPRGMMPQPTPLLREMDWGIYTGQTLEEVNWHHLPSGVESVDELYHRAEEWMNYLRVKYPGKRILAVGHGAFNRAIITCLRGGKPFDMIELPIMENTEIERFIL
ncbi:MAG: histidine phosphatase family protein [Odoribacter sp.]